MHKVSIHTILFYSVIFCATTVGISSCSDTEKSPVKRSEKPTEIVPSALKQPPLEQPSPVAVETLDPETPEPSKPLDLSLMDSFNETTQPTTASGEKIIVPDLLPDLFTDKPEISKPRVSGRLITDEKKEDLVDSIDGVEISVDFQLP